MKTIIKILCLTVCMAIIVFGCNHNNSKSFYNSEFKWSISIPGDFETVSNQQVKENQNREADSIKKYAGVHVNAGRVNTILSLKSGEGTTFDANYQIWKPSDGNYSEALTGAYNLMYNNFKKQFPDAVIDTVSSEEKIDNLIFQKIKYSIKFNNGEALMIMYHRLFGNKNFTVGIDYADPQKGKEILDAWRESKFGTE